MNTNFSFPMILVVDDVRENVLAVTNLIKEFGAQAVGASNGSDALDIVREVKLALCILDVQMPEMDGYELATNIRQSPLNADTPIIFLTAVRIDQISVFKGYRTGAVDYITKPINKEILLSKIRVFLKLEEIRMKLERTEKRYESILQEQSDIVFRTDISFKITFVNNSMATLFNKEAIMMQGLSLFDLFPAIDKANYISEAKKLQPDTNSFSFEHSLDQEDPLSEKKQKWFFHQLNGIFNEYNVLEEYQIVCNDITERKSMEAELIAARRKAEAATESKSRFLANMSHEIRTPMSAIIGMVDLMKETEMSEDAQESMDIIKISANNLLSIVNEILDFSKIEANQIDIEQVKFHLKDLITDVIKVFEYAARDKKIRFLYEIDANVPDEIIGDPVRFRQILINLIGNAVKFTHEGKVDVQVQSKTIDKELIELHIQVKDTGIGISEEGQKRLFKPFAQSGSDTKRKYGGTGLGLAISKNLAELMGGTVGMKSNDGGGSCFWFNVRFKQMKLQEQKTQALTTSKTAMKAGGALTVLIVEDNVLNQKVASATLRKMGHTVDIANNGKVGLEMATSNNYDLIVMDIQMPIMNGLDSTKAIRQYEKEHNINPPVKIVALTANALLNDRDICIEAGMDEYISKPFRKEDFIQVLDRIMV